MKMRHLQSAALVAIAALALTACNDENPWAGQAGKGGITLRLKTDASVKDAAPTRATQTLAAPDADSFSITLEKGDSYSKTWNSLTEFNNADEAFNVGTYTLRATHGNVGAEGFNNPVFSGETKVTVLEGQPATAEITASLANCMVSVDFTDAFTTYFPEYSVDLRSEGAAEGVHIAQAESGTPAYLNPGHVYLSVNLSREIGGQVISTTIQPTDFNTEAKHHYHITLNFNQGNVGEGVFSVVFDDSLTEESVDIDLSDELFTAPAPVLTATGFDPGQTVDLLEGTRSETPVQFSVNAAGKIAKAFLTVESDTYTPAWGKEIDLCAASAATQQQLADAGITCVGFFKNPDRFARIDISKLNLPVGTHTFTLRAQDIVTHESEPLSVTVNVEPVTLEIEPVTSIYGDTTAELTLNYNGGDPKEVVSFKTTSDAGTEVACNATFSELTRSRAIACKSYKVVLALPNKCTRNFPVKVLLNGVTHQMVTVPVGTIEYALSVADAFATYAYLQVDPANDGDLAKATTNAEIKLDGQKVAESNLNRDTETGLIRVIGLEAGKTYAVSSELGDWSTSGLRLTTETAAQLPNSDFSATTQTINISPINAGGEYKYGATTMQNKSSISVSEPNDWATINAKTCYTGASPMNTWFCVPSTLHTSDGVVVRSVAYDHKGTLPGLDNHGLNVLAKYSRNAPGSFAYKSAGELFLGSYSFNGTEVRNEGYTFGSRPTSLTFTCTYSPVNGENALATIALVDATGNIIASKSQKITNSQNSYKVTLPEYPIGKKAAKIQVKFISAEGSSVSAPVPSNFQDVTNKTGLNGQTIATNAYKSLCVGSILTVKSVSLGYECPFGGAAAKPAKKSTQKRSTRR